jgi:hypothetical protein
LFLLILFVPLSALAWESQIVSFVGEDSKTQLETIRSFKLDIFQLGTHTSTDKLINTFPKADMNHFQNFFTDGTKGPYLYPSQFKFPALGPSRPF